MDVTPAPTMTAEHRARLRAAGVEASALDAAEWELLADPVPDWWVENGNAIYFAPGAWLPEKVQATLMLIPVHDVLVVVGSPMEWMASLLVGGDGSTIFIGTECVLTAGAVYCGAASSVVLHGPLTATRNAVVDARNGGSIVTGGEGLWASDVYVATDDMHRFEDVRTGERLNPFGAHIRIGRRVWLCREAVVTGHAEVGDGAVVGMRSIVRGQKVPSLTAVAGAPARVVREGVTWSREDLP